MPDSVLYCMWAILQNHLVDGEKYHGLGKEEKHTEKKIIHSLTSQLKKTQYGGAVGFCRSVNL